MFRGRGGPNLVEVLRKYIECIFFYLGQFLGLYLLRNYLHSIDFLQGVDILQTWQKKNYDNYLPRIWSLMAIDLIDLFFKLTEGQYYEKPLLENRSVTGSAT